MKNRMSIIFVSLLVILAVVGLLGNLMNNPIHFFQSIAVFAVVGVIIYFLVRRFLKASPDKKEQHAFRKAAKRSKKKYLQQKDVRKSSPKSSSITSLKKHVNKHKTASHLTVIEGRKGKKKNRASF